MASLNFQKPDKIILQKATDFEAQFEFRPLEPGYGVTIGNALRRVLLSSRVLLSPYLSAKVFLRTLRSN